MAKSLQGWGRIDLVERIGAQGDESYGNWLVREGFRNKIMFEYLATVAARDGELLNQLRDERAGEDAALLNGAAEIFMALVFGGPVRGMPGYQDGAEASRVWLTLIGGKAGIDLLHASAVVHLHDHADEERCVWTEGERTAIRKLTDGYLASSALRDLVEATLRSGDQEGLWWAGWVASAVGIDAWPFYRDRQRCDPKAGHWWHLMQTPDRDRIAEVVALAEGQFDLAALASGPGEELGLGSEWAGHSNLDCVVQDLDKHPGLGWPLVCTALCAPVVRCRNMGVRALAAWPKAQWPPDALPTLRAAIDIEPCEDVRERMEAALAPDPT